MLGSVSKHGVIQKCCTWWFYLKKVIWSPALNHTVPWYALSDDYRYITFHHHLKKIVRLCSIANRIISRTIIFCLKTLDLWHDIVIRHFYSHLSHFLGWACSSLHLRQCKNKDYEMNDRFEPFKESWRRYSSSSCIVDALISDTNTAWKW